jgi:hypothetical protein
MRLKYLFCGGLMLVGTVFVPLAKAQPPAALWTNTPITFEQNNPDPDDFLTDEVTLTRFGSGTLQNVSSSPTPDTVLWAEGTIDNYGALNYQDMSAYRNGDLQAVLLSTTWVMWLQNENIYIPVTFTEWTRHGGPFAYVRGTAPPPPPVPSVSITSPTNNSVFTAPATFSVTASATVSSGTVTNVTFFANATSLGSVTNSPFTVTANSLPVGSYALKAVATAAGISATSAVVNVTVSAPGTVTLSSSQVTNGVFSFNYNTVSGLKYVVQKSPTFSAWQPVVTNIGSGGLIHFTDAVSGGLNFYRVDQVSGP